MRVTRLGLSDFRNYVDAELEPARGLTVIAGDNGEGKTNLLEAVGYLATLGSFRGAPPDVLVRDGAPCAVVRAEIERRDATGADLHTRVVSVAAEVQRAGRHRVLVNGQPLRRPRDLLGVLRVSVFTPDDLALVKGGPAGRRRFLDTTLVALHPRHDALQTDLERILRQRNALLRSAGGRLGDSERLTLEVFDQRLAAVGEALAAARRDLLERLEPVLAKAYDQLAQQPADVTAAYESAWSGTGLAEALAAARAEELRRGVSLVGPHRDDVALGVGGHPARTHGSQGEQRSLALALRLAAHALVTEVTGAPPVLLLDDVFSELDPGRAEALLAHLPPGQALLTTAGPVPSAARPELVVRVTGGRILS